MILCHSITARKVLNARFTAMKQRTQLNVKARFQHLMLLFSEVRLKRRSTNRNTVTGITYTARIINRCRKNINRYRIKNHINSAVKSRTKTCGFSFLAGCIFHLLYVKIKKRIYERAVID